jgi:hypothetical protein
MIITGLLVEQYTGKRSVRGNGRGLENLAERYRILSGDEILFQSDDNHFSVSLKILKQ